MLCELCQDNEAAVHLTQVIEGDVKKLHLCHQCAAQSGFNVDSALSLTDVLFGMGAPQATDAGAPEKTCRSCHMRRADFRNTSRLGCPACYETFAEELNPLLTGMHHGPTHTGKIPQSAAQAPADAPSVAELQKQLKEAVSKEHYEEAARLRDVIRKLRASDKPGRNRANTGGDR